ncbi:MAG: S9 family peptidase, partial [Bifidobacteriaceae bacterium]|nr:S9 family peptidase [Bifidobacteriaceae bacterium]
MAACAGGAAILGLVGTAAGPKWRPRPLERTVEVESADTAVDGGAPPGGGPGGYRVARTLVRLRLGRGETIVEVTRPDAEGRFPAMVFAHGAGTGNHTAFAEHSAALARDGIACLVPDKQLATYSAFHRDYGAMAQEYGDLARWARGQEWADPERVGYYGESEGGWIVPMAAAGDPRTAFVALVSPPVVTPREQGLFSACAYLRNTGVPEGVFHAAPRFVGSPMPGGRVNYADFQVGPYQRRLSCPVFVAYGTADASMPVIQGALTIVDDLAAAGNGQAVIRYYEANHGLRAGEDQRLAPSFLRDLSAWARGLPETARPARRVAGAPPHQPFWVIPTPKVSWFGRLTVQGGLAAAGFALVAAAPLARTAARLAGKRPGRLRPQLRVPFGLFAGGSAVTVAGFGAYLARVVQLSTSYRRDPVSVVWGYRAVRGVAATSVAGGILLVFRLRDLAKAGQAPARGRAERWRLWTGSLGGAGLLLFGSYWGILP